jgi:hypothetical protein
MKLFSVPAILGTFHDHIFETVNKILQTKFFESNSLVNIEVVIIRHILHLVNPMNKCACENES